MIDKAQLRAELRTRRTAFVQQLDADVAAALGAQLADIVVPHLHGGGSVAAYVRHGAEIDPAAIVDRLQRQGRDIVWPRIDQTTNRLSFHACAPHELAPGFKGLCEPPADAPEVTPDIILLPLVGTDLNGNRIGQGAGHYDRALAALRRDGKLPQTIGLAWEVQIVDRGAPDTWDEQLDALATPQRWIEFPRK